jgi:hypothetical protein
MTVHDFDPRQAMRHLSARYVASREDALIFDDDRADLKRADRAARHVERNV